MKIAIVGLPNVGKSTLFNALVKGSKAEAANYPFCTIEPNVGIVEVPDERLAPLAKVSKSKKIVPTVVEFVDIAGLVRGASKGEGLGNQFLSHIRECDAIAMVVRFFQDDNVTHVAGKINPKDDIETIETELQLADIATVEKRQYNLDRDIKSGSKDAKLEKEALDKIIKKLCDGKNAREADLSEDEIRLIKSMALMTMKPVLYVANCSEDQLINNGTIEQLNNEVISLIPISAKIESELNDLNDAEKKEYLEALGIADTGINRLIKEAYKALNLITYFTSGEPETRAWTVRNGAKAPEAASVIHTDFERGFIAAEVVAWQDLYAQGGWTGARSHGMVRTEGKNYIFKDGDVTLFRFNV
ncbi:MAG: redox-regulated ATPase YchF [Candidatus Berkelbacteria bacterium]|nr:redox-regulated ATPase YchF [Candidatus Berkelbacteria bacterium]